MDKIQEKQTTENGVCIFPIQLETLTRAKEHIK